MTTTRESAVLALFGRVYGWLTAGDSEFAAWRGELERQLSLEAVSKPG